MTNDKKIEADVLQNWTLVGPFSAKPGQDNWFATSMDAPRRVPSDPLKLRGRIIPLTRHSADNGVLDFEKIFSVPIDKSMFGIRRQVIAITEVSVREPSTLVLRYDADWRAVWWIDGREIYSTKDGNAGPVGHVRHKAVFALESGNHVIAVRVICANRGWKLICIPERLEQGIDDVLRTDRSAQWRRYTQTMVRVEHRPHPDKVQADITMPQFENWASKIGVQARWLSVVSQHHGALYKSKHIPPSPWTMPEFDNLIKAWVDEIHKNHMSAMSWYGLVVCKPIWEKHPEWRQKLMVPDAKPHELSKYSCCINSPYGDLVAAFAVEALKKFDLDGIWYDGSFFSPCWVSSGILTCTCDYCCKKFKMETGLDLPKRYDWSIPQFKHWVKWRYSMYSAYWQKLVDTIHKAVPEATVVFNHYHREGIGWNGAIPLNPFGHDFVSGCEADGEPLRAMFYTRLMKAYGRSHTEVWLNTGVACKATANGKDIVSNPRDMTEFAIACTTAGGHCSFGGYEHGVTNHQIDTATKELKDRAGYINLPALPYAAMHVSQQTDTFVFGRNPLLLEPDFKDYYWNSLTGWHHALAFAGLSPDVLFDDHLTSKHLSSYALLVMPTAPSLTRSQYEVVMDYVKRGGILITGPWFGLLDELGEASQAQSDPAVFPFGRTFPDWQQIKQRKPLNFEWRKAKGGADTLTAEPLHAIIDPAEPVSLNIDNRNQTAMITRLGKGTIVQTAFDIGTLFRYSGARIVMESCKDLIRKVADRPPPVEILNSDKFLFGIFTRGARETVIHIQHFVPEWKREDITVTQPAMCWDVKLTWHGARPESARTALPELSPELPVRKTGKSWSIALPPFRWGQIIVLKT